MYHFILQLYLFVFNFDEFSLMFIFKHIIYIIRLSYSLMEDCWNLDPTSRPMFPEIAKRLTDTLDAARQMETPPTDDNRPTSGPHDYLEMVAMGGQQPGYVPLETAVPTEEPAANNNNGMQPKPPSERYTSEPSKPAVDPSGQAYLKPFTQLPESEQLRDDAEGYAGVRRPSQDKERYSSLHQSVNLSPDATDMPNEHAPDVPDNSYLAPTPSMVKASQEAQGGDGYLPPSRVSVEVEGGAPTYSNL